MNGTSRVKRQKLDDTLDDDSDSDDTVVVDQPFDPTFLSFQRRCVISHHDVSPSPGRWFDLGFPYYGLTKPDKLLVYKVNIPFDRHMVRSMHKNTLAVNAAQ